MSMQLPSNQTADLFLELVRIIAKLRDPETGCPWDKEQTHSSLKRYLLEEAYETIDAIDEAPSKLKEELGDVLLQVMLHSQIGADAGTFSIDDVVRGLAEKLVERHPHIFGTVKADTSEEVLKNWESIKQAKAGSKSGRLDGLPKGLPALLKAHRIGEKVGRVGFDWPDIPGVRNKVIEELNEFLETVETPQKDSAAQAEEIGDLLFSLAQLIRKMGYDAEDLLQQGCTKFMHRFKFMEQAVESKGQSLKDLSPSELEKLWQTAKQ